MQIVIQTLFSLLLYDNLLILWLQVLFSIQASSIYTRSIVIQLSNIMMVARTSKYTGNGY